MTKHVMAMTYPPKIEAVRDVLIELYGAPTGWQSFMIRHGSVLR